MATTTTSVVTAGVSRFLNKKALVRAVPKIPHRMFGDVEDLPEANTAVIAFRRYGNLTNATTALTEGVTPANKALSITDVALTLQQYGTFVTLSDKLLGTNPMKLIVDTGGILGDNAGQSLDVIARDVLVAGTVVQYVQTSGVNLTRASLSATDDMGLTAATSNIRSAVNTLELANATPMAPMIPGTPRVGTNPVWEAYWSIIHPNTKLTLQESAEWVPVAEYSDPTQMVPGEVGTIEDVRFVSTTNGKVFSGSGAGSVDVYATLIFGAHAYATSRLQNAQLDNNQGMKLLTTPLEASSSDPLAQRMTMGWKTMLAAGITNNAFMIRIEHTAS